MVNKFSPQGADIESENMSNEEDAVVLSNIDEDETSKNQSNIPEMILSKS